MSNPATSLVRRPESRTPTQTRELQFVLDVNRYAEGSVIVKFGETQVLCTVSVEESVPQWLKGQGSGWLTAEYAMLPRATHTRNKRDREKVSGRTQEIQRLIGRALRAMVNLKALGEKTLMIDCDVLQADGGTRTASITGACVAVCVALHRLSKAGKLAKPLNEILVDTVSAVSIGIKDGIVLTDLDYLEDSGCEVDMNFVMTGGGGFVETQGTAEKKSFSYDQLLAMTQAALTAGRQIRDAQKAALETVQVRLN